MKKGSAFCTGLMLGKQVSRAPRLFLCNTLSISSENTRMVRSGKLLKEIACQLENMFMFRNKKEIHKSSIVHQYSLHCRGNVYGLNQFVAQHDTQLVNCECNGHIFLEGHFAPPKNSIMRLLAKLVKFVIKFVYYFTMSYFLIGLSNPQ